MSSISGWALGSRASEYVTQEGMKVDAALPWRWFVAVEYVGRLNRQMHRGWPELSEATQIEEGGIPLTIGRGCSARWHSVRGPSSAATLNPN